MSAPPGMRSSGQGKWPAIEAARARLEPRVPFLIGGVAAGSVAVRHLPVLQRWADVVAVDAQRVELRDSLGDVACRSTALAELNRALHAEGHVVGWRDETYAVVTAQGREPMALIERTASRFWGTLTFGAHCNGYVADEQGRPTHLWVARRSHTKPTDPGMLDNLVGGGVPHGQSPFEALVREGWEEAGLGEALMRRAVAGSVIELHRDIPEGLQWEHLFAHDLALTPGTAPANQDGEVAELLLVPVRDAIEMASDSEMTVDASLVVLDFALRWRLVDNAECEALGRRAADLLLAR